MFENPMEMYNPYYATSDVNQMNKQRGKMDYNSYVNSYCMDDSKDNMYHHMDKDSSYHANHDHHYDDYMMDKKREMKSYNDYYMMKNGMSNDMNSNMNYMMKDMKDMNNNMDYMMKDNMKYMDKDMDYMMNNDDMMKPYMMDNMNKMDKMDMMDMKDNMMGKDNMLVYNKMSYMPANPEMTMAYVPYQDKSMMYSDEMALKIGTMFEALDKPFEGRSV